MSAHDLRRLRSSGGVLALVLTLIASIPSAAEEPAAVELTLVGGGSVSFDEMPSSLRVGGRVTYWAHRGERLRVGAAWPLLFGRGKLVENGFETAVTTYDLMQTVRAAYQATDLVRPYAELGAGAGLITHTLKSLEFEGRSTSTEPSLIARLALGVELTPASLPGLLLSLELPAVHARFTPPRGGDIVYRTTFVEGMLLLGVGYEF